MTIQEEILCVNLGQTGLQLNSAFWELLTIEHGLSPDGSILDDTIDHDGIDCLFHINNNNSYTPNNIMIDSEPSVINELKTGAYRNLFDRRFMLHRYEDASNNYARGTYVIGKQLAKSLKNMIRRCIEQYDCLKGFMIFHSSAGGTGSGLSALVHMIIFKQFPKAIKSTFNIVSNFKTGDTVTEPYNFLLHNSAAMPFSDISYLLENQSLINIWRNNFKANEVFYNDINRLTALLVSSITSNIRFTSNPKNTLDNAITNLVPYPRIHFPIIRYEPLMSESESLYSNLSTAQMTNNLFRHSNNQSVCVDMLKGRYMSVVINYQGDVSMKDIYSTITDIQNKFPIKFVEWSPRSYKISVCRRLPTTVPLNQLGNTNRMAVSMLANNSSIGKLFRLQLRKFKSMLHRRCFIHWYINEGMEEIEFTETKDDIEALMSDYEELVLSESEIIKILMLNRSESRRSFISTRLSIKNLSSYKDFKSSVFSQPDNEIIYPQDYHL